jgi:hypothetical protein
VEHAEVALGPGILDSSTKWLKIIGVFVHRERSARKVHCRSSVGRPQHTEVGGGATRRFRGRAMKMDNRGAMCGFNFFDAFEVIAGW